MLLWDSMIILPAKSLFFLFFMSFEDFTFNPCQRLTIHDLTIGLGQYGMIDGRSYISGLSLTGTGCTVFGHFAYLASMAFDVIF